MLCFRMKIGTMKIFLALLCALQKFTIVQENRQGFEWPLNHRYHMSSALGDTNYRTESVNWPFKLLVISFQKIDVGF
jgi:hypothetical protein